MKVSTFKGRTSEICEDKTGTHCIGKAPCVCLMQDQVSSWRQEDPENQGFPRGWTGSQGVQITRHTLVLEFRGLVEHAFHEQNLGAAEDSLWERCRCHPICTRSNWVGDLWSAAGRGVTGGGAAGQGGAGGLEASGRLRGGGYSHDGLAAHGPAGGGLPGGVHAHRGLAAHGHMSGRLAGLGEQQAAWQPWSSQCGTCQCGAGWCRAEGSDACRLFP